MESHKKEFLILEALDSEENITQRQLSRQTGVSLGQVNYVLKSLMAKGFVKLDKFHRNNNKAKYVYLLTPKGIEAKSRLAVKFVISKLQEYDSLRSKIEERLIDIQDKGFDRFIFLGPKIVNDLIDSVIKDKHIPIAISEHKTDIFKINKRTCKATDIIVFFDDNPEVKSKITEFTEISNNNIISLV